MDWWEVLLCVLINAIWMYFFITEIIIIPIIENFKYNKKRKKWDKENPNLQRIKCKNCKYAKKETLWSGRYPHGIPTRHAVYCSLTKRKIAGNTSRCIISEPPTNYFYESKNKIAPIPSLNAEVYYSAYGNCYHSTPYCRSVKNSQHLYSNRMCLTDRYPCPKCWVEKDGVLYPIENKGKIK